MNVTFDLAQIITIVSVILVIIGWFVNQWLNRKNEIVKEARSYRLDMLDSIIKFRNDWVKTKNVNQQLWDECYTKVQLYGLNDELVAFENLRKEMEKEQDDNKNQMGDYLIKLVILCRNRIREELKIEKIDEP